jgi:GTP-binding protein
MSGFVDEAQLNVQGGDGGAGCVSFRREGPVAFGGPNGGDGGKGGDIWLVADRNVASLLAFKDHPHRRAENGVHGQGKDMHGKRGRDLEVHVPEGTVVTDMYTGELLADLANHGDRWMAVAGGRGGRGNAKFLSNRRRAPSFAEQGEHGEERWLKLEIKLMADVALVGFPNVGKSTLISVISAARPKIANYPFTTLEPNLGVVRQQGLPEFVVADIPGLIEGASEGKGLGHKFLKHIERARVLCVMLDRPRVVVGTKADSAIFDWDGMSVSSITNQGVRELVRKMAELVQQARSQQPDTDGIVIIRPEPEGARVERLDEHEFRLVGKQVERVVALNDVTTPEALSYIDYQLKRLGVPKMLAKAGALDGDVIWIAGFSFEYHEEV